MTILHWYEAFNGKDTNKLIKQQYGPCAQLLGPRELSEEELRQRELKWLLAFY